MIEVRHDGHLCLWLILPISGRADLSQQGISRKDLKGCIILINGKPANKRSSLQDGDVVQLLSPIAGG